MDAAAGKQVAANASHFARMLSMSRRMKSASRTLFLHQGTYLL